MMRIFILIMACAVSSCATPRKPCPPLPLMQQTETMKDYTLRIIALYDECSKS